MTDSEQIELRKPY